MKQSLYQKACPAWFIHNSVAECMVVTVKLSDILWLHIRATLIAPQVADSLAHSEGNVPSELNSYQVLTKMEQKLRR